MSEILMEREEKFVIDSDQKAEWALQKIREMRADQAKWKDYYKAQMAAMDAEADANVGRMEEMLKAYFQNRSEADFTKHTKTQEYYTLPTGKLVIKKQEPEYKRDEPEVIKWLKKNNMNQFVKVKESLDWDGLKKATAVLNESIVTEDAEVIPGITVVARPDIFKVEVK